MKFVIPYSKLGKYRSKDAKTLNKVSAEPWDKGLICEKLLESRAQLGILRELFSSTQPEFFYPHIFCSIFSLLRYINLLLYYAGL